MTKDDHFTTDDTAARMTATSRRSSLIRADSDCDSFLVRTRSAQNQDCQRSSALYLAPIDQHRTRSCACVRNNRSIARHRFRSCSSDDCEGLITAAEGAGAGTGGDDN
eukprot:6188771-Pleurochrysis_carterae.AAC.2